MLEKIWEIWVFLRQIWVKYGFYEFYGFYGSIESPAHGVLLQKGPPPLKKPTLKITFLSQVIVVLEVLHAYLCLSVHLSTTSKVSITKNV